MSIKQLLNKWLNGKQPTWNVKNEHQIIKAFMLDGEQYYQFRDINATMSGRAFACLDYYNELSMKVDKEYLEKHCEAVEALLSDPKKINVGELYNLNKQIKERLTMILVPEQVYKLASVVYFDGKEAPYDYDFNYNQEKIKKFKNMDLDAFFFKTQLKDLIPSLTLSAADLKTYWTVAEQVDQKHLEKLSTLK